MTASPAPRRDPHLDPWIDYLLAEAGFSSELRRVRTRGNQKSGAPTEVVSIFDGDRCVAFAKRALGKDAETRAASEIEACRRANSVYAGHGGMVAPEVLATHDDGAFLLSAVPGVPANLAFSRRDRALRSEQIRRVARMLAVFHDSAETRRVPFSMGERVPRLRMRLNHFTGRAQSWPAHRAKAVAGLGTRALDLHASIEGDMRPESIQHGDTIPLNILMSPGQVGLVDFEFCRRTWRVVDAATLLDRLTTSCPFGEAESHAEAMFDPRDVSAFAEGYGEDPTERAEFVVFARFELLARILTAAEAEQQAPLVLLDMVERALRAPSVI